MCYDAKTSLGTFGFVSLIAAYLWIRNGPSDRAIGLILLVIASMQVAEFIIWTYLGETVQNRIASLSIPVILYLQPLLIALILLVFKAGWYPQIYTYIIGLFTIAAPFYFGYLSTLSIPPYTTLGPNGHLQWPLVSAYTDPIVYIFRWIYGPVLIFLFLTFKKAFVGIPLIIAYNLSYVYYKYYYDREWSSIWCHLVNFIAVIALL